MKARNRPPKLEATASDQPPAPPPSIAELVERARLAGANSGPAPGPTELRSVLERVVAGDRRALGEVAPVGTVSADDAWDALGSVYGATRDAPYIDPVYTIAATRHAAERVRAIAHAGGRIAFATAHPASLLGLHLAAAEVARRHGADVVDLADVGPIHAGGSASRWVRWIDGVAAVTDGHALLGCHHGEAAREWMFVIPRPSLVVADGPFIETAWEAGVEVVGFAGLDRPALAIAARHHTNCLLVPLRTDRPPRNYHVLAELIRDSERPSDCETCTSIGGRDLPASRGM